MPAPESGPADGLLNNPNAIDRNADDEFPPIEKLLDHPIEVLDLTEENPPLGQSESPCQQPMAKTNGHSQSTADIL